MVFKKIILEANRGDVKPRAVAQTGNISTDRSLVAYPDNKAIISHIDALQKNSLSLADTRYFKNLKDIVLNENQIRLTGRKNDNFGVISLRGHKNDAVAQIGWNGSPSLVTIGSVKEITPKVATG
ncbi:MAG: hypothetical protein EU981_02935 [Candidatus Liberibacter ctenarytainae]|uniref:Uncharacterized protein n=1 Tax=Candidatus Liberibacter ctenarytainae TaxID=2020335 RepID=A0A937DJ39_9HYPH|nr:hypothetical protein [Candidatus Liberibacter ctenarytainae]